MLALSNYTHFHFKTGNHMGMESLVLSIIKDDTCFNLSLTTHFLQVFLLTPSIKFNAWSTFIFLVCRDSGPVEALRYS